MIKKEIKPWGFELIFAHTGAYVGKILHINAGQSLSLQYHNIKDETIMVQYGRIQLEHYKYGNSKDRKIIDMVPGDVFHIKPKYVHRMTACQDAELIEVSTPELNDIVRLEDRYGRTSHKKNDKVFVINKFFRWIRRWF